MTVTRWRLTDMSFALSALPAKAWTPIAYRQHDEPQWVAVPGAPLTIEQAEELRRDGLIHKFNRREATATAIVVRRRAA